MTGRRRILVTGAGGGLGRRVVRRLQDAGWTVTGLYRNRPIGADAADQVVCADITSLEWKGLLPGHESVCHLAAYVHKPSREPAEERLLREVNVSATASLARACREAQAQLVFASTVSVFGPGANQPLSDVTTVQPATPYGRSKRDAECAIEAEGLDGLRYAILRFPLLYGPRGRGNMERLLRAIARRRYWPVGPGQVKKSCLYFDDAAEAIRLALDLPAGGTPYLVAPPVPDSLRGIHQAAYAAFGRKPPLPLPGSLALAGAIVADGVARLLGRRTEFAQQVKTLVSPVNCDGSRFASLTGFRPTTTISHGLGQTANWIATDTSRT